MTRPDRQPESVHAALRERNALWAQALRARALAREVEAERTLLGLRRSSRSWRVTAPLRRLLRRAQPPAR